MKKEKIKSVNSPSSSEIKIKSATEVSEFAENFIDTVREPLLALDQDLRVIKASRSFYDFSKVAPDETIGTLIYDLGNKQWDIPKLRNLLEKILPQKSSFENYEVEHDFSSIGKRTMLLNTRQIERAFGKDKVILLAIEDITEFKKAEEPQHASFAYTQSQYARSLIEASLDPLVTISAQGKITDVNEASVQVTGVAREKLIGRDFSYYFTEPDKARAGYQKVFSEGFVRDYPLAIRHTTGRITNVLYNAAIYKDEKGDVLGVFAAARDVTDHMKIEAGLEKTRKELEVIKKSADEVSEFAESIINTVREPLLVLDQELRVIKASRSFYDFFKVNPDETIGKLIYNLGNDQWDIPELRELLETILPEKTTFDKFEVEHSFSAIGKRTMLLNARQIERALGNEKVILLAIEDITAHKLAEAEIRKNRVELQLILNTTAEGIYGIDMEGKCTFCNHACLNILGYQNHEELLGKNMHELTHGKYADGSLFPVEKCRISQAFKLNQKAHVDDEVLWKADGTSFAAEYWSFPQELDGKVVGAVVSFLNIEKRKIISRQLEEAKEIADSANKAKSEFLANMSHEIRTPMNAILGFDHLLQKTELSAKQRGYAVKIGYSAQSLLEIINDILDFSKIEAGKLEIEKVDFNLNAVLDNLSNMMKVKVEHEDLEMIIGRDLDVPVHLIGDPLRLGQVLLNISSNAIKFTDKGEIEIKVEKVKLTGTKAILKFSARDTGIGLTQKQIDRLFQKFQQADSSTTRRFGGTGLGLSISKKLVEMMNGEIGVKSTPGKGSTFFFTARFGISAVKKEHGRLVPEALNGMNVLIVEDNETAREVLIAYCRDFSFKAKIAVNGAEALNILREDSSISLVIMDLKMPVMDGWEATTEIRDDPRIMPKPKIIMITNYDRQDLFNQVESIGLDGFLIKPVSQSQLLDTIIEIFVEKNTFERNLENSLYQSVELNPVKGAYLLLVEDNELNQQVAVELLESEGFEVDIAGNGLIAVEKIMHDTEHYDLVLMDLQMPVMDGYVATATVRANHDFDSLPIVAMTADAMSDVEEKVLTVGMNDYITKPINVDELYRILLKWIKPAKRRKLKVKKQKPGEREKWNKVILPEIAGIDIADGLKRVAGNKAIYWKILKQFADSNQDFKARIELAIKDKDKETAVRHAHSLKGVAGNIGALELQLAAKELETVLKENLGNAKMLHAKIKAVSDLLLPMTEKIISFQKDLVPNEAVKSKKLDFAEVKSIYEELKKYLSIYNFKAVEIFGKMKNMLTGYGYDKDLLELEKCINAYDFDKASEVLKRILPPKEKLK